MRSTSSLACHNDRDQKQLITVLGLYRFKDDGSVFAGIGASGLVTSSRKGFVHCSMEAMLRKVTAQNHFS